VVRFISSQSLRARNHAGDIQGLESSVLERDTRAASMDVAGKMKIRANQKTCQRDFQLVQSPARPLRQMEERNPSTALVP
jgi:hypothetical protein